MGVFHFYCTANFPPMISADPVFRVNLGEESINVYSITVEDEGDDFTLSVQGGLPPNSMLEKVGKQEYIFQWKLVEVTTMPLIFVANDTKGASSVFVATVEVCACVNGGTCTLDGLLTSNKTKVMNCLCNEGNIFLIIKAS